MMKTCGKCKKLIDEKELERVEVKSFTGYRTDLYCKTCIEEYNKQDKKGFF